MQVRVKERNNDQMRSNHIAFAKMIKNNRNHNYKYNNYNIVR